MPSEELGMPARVDEAAPDKVAPDMPLQPAQPARLLSRDELIENQRTRDSRYKKEVRVRICVKRIIDINLNHQRRVGKRALACRVHLWFVESKLSATTQLF